MCKDPPQHTQTLKLPLTLKQSTTFTYPLPKGSPSSSLCSFACSHSLEGREASTFTALSSQPWSGSSQTGGTFGRMFKDLFHSRLSKGKNAVWSCWCKGIVKNCVFVYSCVEQVTFLADEGPLFSEKDCYRGVSKCWSDSSSLNLRFSFLVWL